MARGIDVDGIDSSADMIDRLQRRAAERDLDADAWAAIIPLLVPEPTSEDAIDHTPRDVVLRYSR